MKIVLVGYYGYKNFGDELLLLWLLKYLNKHYEISTLSIVSPERIWLEEWLERHKNEYWFFDEIASIKVIDAVPSISREVDALVIWGGEVLTDARKVPYNGRNYLLRYRHYVWHKKLIFAGGIGTIIRPWTHFLYKRLLWTAQSVITREKYSYEIIKKYTNKGILHNDFAYDALEWIDAKSLISSIPGEYSILNCNTHIYTPASLEKITQWVKVQEWLGRALYFIAWTAGEDDSDVVIYHKLKKLFPTLNYLDRTKYSVKELAALIWWAKHGLAARLHVVLMLDWAWVPFEPLVYQEKVQRLLDKE